MASADEKPSLREILDGLNQGDFEKFRSRLQQHELRAYFPSWVMYEGAGRGEFTDRLLSVSGSPEVLPAIADTLRQIGCHSEADQISLHTRFFNQWPSTDWGVWPPIVSQGPDTDWEDRQPNAYEAASTGRVVRPWTHVSPTLVQLKFPTSWIKLQPDVKCVDAPIYSFDCGPGTFECSVSGLRWFCKEKVIFQYAFESWEEHTETLEIMKEYIPAGPLLDITVISGKLDEVYLPHWICTDNNPAFWGKFAVLHVDGSCRSVEEVSQVTPSHVRLVEPIFSQWGVLMKIGFPVKINCKVLIFKTNKEFLTLNVYLIPRDPALEKKISDKELSKGNKMIDKPYPVKPLKMRGKFILTADKEDAEIIPGEVKLTHNDPNFFEVFIRNPDCDFKLRLAHQSEPVWTCPVRKNDYQRTGAAQMTYDEELARVRPKLVRGLTSEVINQLLDDLLCDNVFNDGEREDILMGETRAHRARALIDTVKLKGCRASKMMLTHLQSRDPMLFSNLNLLLD